MERNGITRLEAWKNHPRRKPLLLLGARQVGKTWLAQEFAQRHYRWMAYVRFDKDEALRESFGLDFNVKRLLNEIQLSTGVPVEAGETLILLDEIQDCPAALTALKYFCEEAREQHIVTAGSLPGVELHHGVGFPVDKAERNLTAKSLRSYCRRFSPRSHCTHLHARLRAQPLSVHGHPGAPAGMLHSGHPAFRHQPNHGRAGGPALTPQRTGNGQRV